MPYLLLGIAIVAEVLATSALPRTHGFTLVLPSLGAVAGYGLAAFLLAQVVRSMSVGAAYAIWSGVGTLTVVVIGATFLGQSVSLWQAGGIGLVIVGVIMINLGGAIH